VITLRDFFSGRFFRILVLIAVFLAGFMVNMAFDGGVTAPRDIVGVIVTPISSAGTWVKNSVTDFFSSFSEYNSLRAENEQLRKNISELQKELLSYYNTDVEMERLRQLSGVKETIPDVSFIAADIVSVSGDGYGSVYSLNKGTSDGIELKAVAVSADGLVGKVTAVGLNWATVTAITDPSMSVGAVIPRTEDVGMTESSVSLRSEGKLKLSYIPVSTVIMRGDEVYTSGLGGIYPYGIKIGTVSDVVVEDNGLTQYAVVEPAADLENLRRVYISDGAWDGQ